MKPDYGRTTITVPWDLKSRMKKARSRVNWSAVACQAFEEKLEELGPIEEINSVEEAAKRMKDLQDEFSSAKDAASQSGNEAGAHWAMNFARPGQLKRIDALRSQHSDKAWRELMTSKEGWKELTKCIRPNIDTEAPRKKRGPNHDETFDDCEPKRGKGRRRRGNGGGPGGPMRGRELWRSILDGRPDHPGFFLGFATGALGVWDQIKDQF